jgi:hypothetical protein
MNRLNPRLALLAAAFFVCGAAQERSKPTLTTLVPSDIHDASVPLFSYQANPQCDTSGNMYFHPWSSKGPLANILRVSPDGNEGKLLSVPEEYSQRGQVSFTDFSVSPGGNVFVLLGIGSQAYIFRFDSSGDLDKAIPVDVSQQGLGVYHIAGFDSGAALLFGNYDGGPDELKGSGYLAVLDRADHLSLAPPLALSKMGLEDEMQRGGASAQDGDAYFISGDDILVISQTGEMLRRIRVEKPDPRASLQNIRVSGNWALIDLVRPIVAGNSEAKSFEPGTPASYQFLLVDTFEGETLGFYELPKDLSHLSEVCFSRNEGLKFMRIEKGKVKLFVASL